jgi:alkylation response protein AidB-like acyl-CoA dehydrogenase
VTSPASELQERTEALLADGPSPTADGGVPFRRAQFDAGLAWVHFPSGCGGMGLASDLQHVVDERLRTAGVPDLRPFNPIGHFNVAPLLVHHGTDEQRRRFLRSTFTSELIWCQLMSEPTAGSDVAGLATRAVRDGDSWIVNGQKVWTGFAHVASFGILVARSDPEAVKHAGITCFLVDMASAGIEVRPLRQLTGRAEFNEVFLTDVAVPDAMRIGDAGAGWSVVSSNLEGERLAFGGGASGAAAFAPPVLFRWRALGLTDALRRDRLARLYAQLWATDLTIARAAQLRAAGRDAVHPSAVKVLRSETARAVAEADLDLLGAAGTLYPGGYADGTQDEDFHQGGTLQERFLRTRAGTIEAGTSEVNRNVLGERALGLPRDVRVDLGRPWREIPR